MASKLYKGLDPLATTSPPVVNNLTSTSTTSALSAYQGKALLDFLNGRDYIDTDYGNNTYKLRGKTVTLIIEGRTNITLSAWGNVQIGQVPQDMRPAYSVNYPLPLQAADNSQRNVVLTVSQGGIISLINQSGGSVTVGATLRTTVTYNI